MASRLAHRKSRRGCLRCKERKVKCDEKAPTCGACDRHGVACTYPDLVRFNQPSKLVSRNPPSPCSDTLSPCETEGRRLSELRLLHCYLTKVVPSLYADDYNDLVKHVWSVMVPTLALQHPFLLHALLSTAALYLTIKMPNASPDRIGTQDSNGSPVVKRDGKHSSTSINMAAHRHYLNMAVQKQREVIANLASENADAASFATLLISNQCFLLMDTCKDEPYTPPYRWMLLASSSPAVVRTAATMVSENAAILSMIKGSGFLFPPLTSERAENRECFQSLLNWERYPEADLSDEVQLAYEQALNYLGSIYTGIQHKESQSKLSRRLFGFAAIVPKIFLDFVDQTRPRALVILAHLFAMTKIVDDVWWFRGAAERHVHGIKSIVPNDWQWAMDWPLRFMASQSP